MLFLDLMLNAFSSVIELNQTIEDQGPSPPAAAGSGTPIAAAGGAGIAPGYPYPPFVGAVVAPNQGFSNISLLSDPTVAQGGPEIWYQMQIANYLLAYQRHETAVAAAAGNPPPFLCRREGAMPLRQNVDFFLCKTEGGVVYHGYYELKVQLLNTLNFNGFDQDILKTARYVQNNSVIQNPAIPAANPVNREFISMLFLHQPNIFGAFTVAQLQQFQSLNRFAGNQPQFANFPYQGPYPGNPPPGGMPLAYPAIPAAPNVPAITPYPPPVGAAYIPFPATPWQPPGIIHFFQPIRNAAANTYTFQEVAAANVNQNNPLLCVYNGN